jgi:hypothetical protein
VVRMLAVTAAAAALAGCALGAPQQTAPVLAGEALAGKRVAVTTQPPPPLGAGSVGEDLPTAYGIGDPAARIGRGVALSLVSERGMTLLLDDGAEADADYVIDVQTREWALDPYPLSRSRYRLKYAARLRLLDRADGRVLVESSCRSEQGDSDNPPTRDALVADNAALVKGYLEMATAACVDVAVRESLRLRDASQSVIAAAGAVSGSASHAAAHRTGSAEDLPASQPDALPALRLESSQRPRPSESARSESVQADPDQPPRRDGLSAAARASGQVIGLLKDTPFRDSPRHVSPVTTILPKGMEVVVRQRIYNAEGEWWFIAVPGDVGWIPSPDPMTRGGP